MFNETKNLQIFKGANFNTLLFADDQFTIPYTEDNLQMTVYSLYNVSKVYNLEIAQKRRSYLVSLGQIT